LICTSYNWPVSWRYNHRRPHSTRQQELQSTVRGRRNYIFSWTADQVVDGPAWHGDHIGNNSLIWSYKLKRWYTGNCLAKSNWIKQLIAIDYVINLLIRKLKFHKMYYVYNIIMESKQLWVNYYRYHNHVGCIEFIKLNEVILCFRLLKVTIIIRIIHSFYYYLIFCQVYIIYRLLIDLLSLLSSTLFILSFFFRVWLNSMRECLLLYIFIWTVWLF